jgi:Na+-transporting NADH:ubiquinone oxidoreductase subunit NqrB
MSIPQAPPRLTTALPAEPQPIVAPAPRPRPAWLRLFTFNNRYLAPILITLILICSNWWYGNLDNLSSPFLAWLTGGYLTTFSPTFAAILSALGMELILGRTVRGRWPVLASAYISGISAGILVKSAFLWPYVMCATISIASKYALRVRGRHLWNPTNFGVTAMLFLAPATVGPLNVQSGNSIWPVIIIWSAGALILGRIGRLHIPLSFVAAFLPLAYVRGLITGDGFVTEVAPLTGPMYQLFMCFMITDPPTTPRAKWAQCLVAVLVAVMECILRLNEDLYAPFHALFIVGPIANLVEIALDVYRARVRAAVAPA